MEKRTLLCLSKKTNNKKKCQTGFAIRESQYEGSISASAFVFIVVVIIAEAELDIIAVVFVE